MALPSTPQASASSSTTPNVPQPFTTTNQTPRGVWFTLLLGSLLALAAPVAANLYRSFASLDWRDHHSYEDGRYLVSAHDVVWQEADPTGAAAVLATLLLWRGEPTTELDLLDTMNAAGGADTLADVARHFGTHGFTGQWRELTAAGLYHLHPPFVVHLSSGSSRLALVRDARQGYIYLADPIFGNVVMPEAEFIEEWSGLALILEHPPAVPR